MPEEMLLDVFSILSILQPLLLHGTGSRSHLLALLQITTWDEWACKGSVPVLDSSLQGVSKESYP